MGESESGFLQRDGGGVTGAQAASGDGEGVRSEFSVNHCGRARALNDQKEQVMNLDTIAFNPLLFEVQQEPYSYGV